MTAFVFQEVKKAFKTKIDFGKTIRCSLFCDQKSNQVTAPLFTLANNQANHHSSMKGTFTPRKIIKRRVKNGNKAPRRTARAGSRKEEDGVSVTSRNSMVWRFDSRR